MDNQKELLEIAAKAAGIVGVYHEMGEGMRIETNPGHDWWNPLEDDGDAFRLQVEFNLEIYHSDNEGHSAVFVAYEVKGNDELQYVIEYIDDLKNLNCKLKATRRAIVRAAAEIGKKL